MGKTSVVLAIVAIVSMASLPRFALEAADLQILVFTRTEGFAHGSIADGLEMFDALADDEGWTLDATDGPGSFSLPGIDAYDVVVFLSTTGDVLDSDHEAAMQAFVEGGGGWLGIHAAADCEYDWAWYGELLGNDAWFLSHPAIQPAQLVVEQTAHPGSGTFPEVSQFSDEWYNFRSNPRPAVEVIMTLDEVSYDPGAGSMGADHPIVWSHRVGEGRAFYTALGHRAETYSEPVFIDQIRGAVLWAAGHLLFWDGFERGSPIAWTDPG